MQLVVQPQDPETITCIYSCLNSVHKLAVAAPVNSSKAYRFTSVLILGPWSLFSCGLFEFCLANLWAPRKNEAFWTTRTNIVAINFCFFEHNCSKWRSRSMFIDITTWTCIVLIVSNQVAAGELAYLLKVMNAVQLASLIVRRAPPEMRIMELSNRRTKSTTRLSFRPVILNFNEPGFFATQSIIFICKRTRTFSSSGILFTRYLRHFVLIVYLEKSNSRD